MPLRGAGALTGRAVRLPRAQDHPDKVKGLVLVEPAGFGDMARAHVLKDTPMVAIFGDFIEQDARWPTIRGNVLRFMNEVGKTGNTPDVIDLPQIGIKGNSHMMMMDRNSDQIAGIIQQWLERKGFVR